MPSEPVLKRLILAAYGSAGDVYPFLWLGRALQERGLRVILIAPAVFEQAALKCGLSFLPLGTAEDFERLAKSPGIWHPFLGTWHVLAALKPWLRQAVEGIARLLSAPGTALISTAPNFAATLAALRTQRPRLTVHLQPAALFSGENTPVYGHGWSWLRKMPRWFRRGIFHLPTPADWVLGRGIHKLCREYGLTPPARLIRDWWHSDSGILCLFPEWFAQPARDWPRPFFQSSFPLFEPPEQKGAPPELAAFLRRGAPPVVVTAGSAMGRGRHYFQNALEAAAMLNVRVVLVSAYPECLPSPLPEWSCHVRYVPFWWLFPRCCVVAHHGGIGTTAQAFAAGVPQLIVPIAHDQPDNAARVAGLGCGLSLPLTRRNPRHWKEALEALLKGPGFAAAAKNFARLLPPPGQCSDAAPVADAALRFLQTAMERRGGDQAVLSPDCRR